MKSCSKIAFFYLIGLDFIISVAIAPTHDNILYVVSCIFIFTHNPLIKQILFDLKFEFNHTETLDSIRQILDIWGNVWTLSMCDWSAIQINQVDLQIASVASGSLSCSFVKHQPSAFLLIILLFNCTQEGHWLTGFIDIISQSACLCFPFILHTCLKQHNCTCTRYLLVYSKYCKETLTSVTCPLNLQRSPHYWRLVAQLSMRIYLQYHNLFRGSSMHIHPLQILN